MLKKIFSFGLLILLTGCANLNSQFDCPVQKGVNCKRLSTVNEEQTAKKGLFPNENKKIIYAKNNTLDVYFKGYEDGQGIYHHPRRITVPS